MFKEQRLAELSCFQIAGLPFQASLGHDFPHLPGSIFTEAGAWFDPQTRENERALQVQVPGQRGLRLGCRGPGETVVC